MAMDDVLSVNDLSPEQIQTAREQFVLPNAPKRAQWRGWANYVLRHANRHGNEEIDDWDELDCGKNWSIDWIEADMLEVYRSIWIALRDVIEAREIQHCIHDGHSLAEWSHSTRVDMAEWLGAYLTLIKTDDYWWELGLALNTMDRLCSVHDLAETGMSAVRYYEARLTLAKYMYDNK